MEAIMGRPLLLLAAAIAALLHGVTATAQDWGLNWIHHPTAQADEQVWFRRTLTGNDLTGGGEGKAKTEDAQIETARIDVASRGTYVLFVNGYNVSAYMPQNCGGEADSTIRVTSHDVTRFLRPDTNVVAVWYSPVHGAGLRQLALTMHGTLRRGDRSLPFAHRADGTWLCRTNGCRTTHDGRETADARTISPRGPEAPAGWHSRRTAIIQWLQADVAQPTAPMAQTVMAPMHRATRTAHIYACDLTDSTAGRLTYSCGRAFCGMVRVTLRGMQRGDRLNIDGLEYVCSGQTDEQACRRFTTTHCSAISIEGPSRLSPDNVTSVEGIETETYLHCGWLY